MKNIGSVVVGSVVIVFFVLLLTEKNNNCRRCGMSECRCRRCGCDGLQNIGYGPLSVEGVEGYDNSYDIGDYVYGTGHTMTGARNINNKGVYPVDLVGMSNNIYNVDDDNRLFGVNPSGIYPSGNFLSNHW